MWAQMIVSCFVSVLDCCLGTGFKASANWSILGDNCGQWSPSCSTTG